MYALIRTDFLRQFGSVVLRSLLSNWKPWDFLDHMLVCKSRGSGFRRSLAREAGGGLSSGSHDPFARHTPFDSFAYIFEALGRTSFLLHSDLSPGTVRLCETRPSLRTWDSGFDLSEGGLQCTPAPERQHRNICSESYSARISPGFKTFALLANLDFRGRWTTRGCRHRAHSCWSTSEGHK